MFEKLRDALETWERGERLEGRALDELALELDAWVDAELGEVVRQADAGQGDAALGRLSRLGMFASAAAGQRPSLANAIHVRMGAFRKALESVARSLGAVDFSISLGLPVSLSFSLTFIVRPTGANGPAPLDAD